MHYPFNPEAHISGYNLFISAYHGFAQLGDERIPAPKPCIPFPEFSITSLQIEEKDPLLTFSKNTDNRFRIVTKILLTYPGSGIRPGMMRYFLIDTQTGCRSREMQISVVINQ